jgi:hypothetical protein
MLSIVRSPISGCVNFGDVILAISLIQGEGGNIFLLSKKIFIDHE